MSAPGYRQYIDAAHPLINTIWGDALCLDKRNALDIAIARIRAHITYRPVRGRVGFDKLIEMREKEAPTPSPANCFDLSALLVSCLRRAGFSPDEVFVVVCDRFLLRGHARTDFHACTFVRLGADVFWVDPADLEVVSTNGVAIFERYKIHLIFNDSYVIVTKPEQQRIILGNMPHTGLQCFLFGRGDPSVWSLVREPSFLAALAGYFRDGNLDLVDSPVGERAIAANLFSRRADGRFEPGKHLVLTNAQAERDFHAAVAVHVDRYVGIVAETLPRLRAAYEATASAAHFSWQEVCHSVVAGMFLDLAIGNAIHIRDNVQKSHGSYVIWAFENIQAQNGFGVRWLSSPGSHYGIVQLWHTRVERPELRIDANMVQHLARYALGEQVSLQGAEALMLRFSKVLRGNTIAVPFFGPNDTERLLEPLTTGAERVVREAMLPALEHLKRFSAWSQVSEDEHQRHAAVRLLLEYGVDRVIDAGLLAPFPNSREAALPPSWGTFLWIEQEGRPLRLVREPEE